MIEIPLLGLNIILFVIVWHFMLRKTVVDTCRDHLFDLREETRAFFSTNGRTLNDPAYLALRDQINGYIRFIEHATFTRVFITSQQIQGNKELWNHLRQKHDERFASNDVETQKFVTKIRQASSFHIHGFVLHSSPLCVLFTYMIFACILVYVSVRLVQHIHTITMAKFQERLWSRLFKLTERWIAPQTLEMLPQAG